jgi:hypothetical protein
MMLGNLGYLGNLEIVSRHVSFAPTAGTSRWLRSRCTALSRAPCASDPSSAEWPTRREAGADQVVTVEGGHDGSWRSLRRIRSWEGGGRWAIR